MQSPLISLLLSAGTFLAAPAAHGSEGVSEKVLRQFHQTFPQAQREHWEELADHYSVEFFSQGTHEWVNYDKDGNFLSSLRYLSGQHLPTSLLTKLEKRFSGFSIFGVTEITTESAVQYDVKMEDAHHWITVHIDGSGSLQVSEKLEKQP